MFKDLSDDENEDEMGIDRGGDDDGTGTGTIEDKARIEKEKYRIYHIGIIDYLQAYNSKKKSFKYKKG